jgi:hypothetical protein
LDGSLVVFFEHFHGLALGQLVEINHSFNNFPRALHDGLGAGDVDVYLLNVGCAQKAAVSTDLLKTEIR